jgi:type II secretory pathway pseudopilin PulG
MATLPLPKRLTSGFTLVELLIGAVLSSLALGSVAFLAVHQIRLADSSYASATVDRSFRRLSDLLRVEVGEACLLRRGLDPRTTAILPDTPCSPEQPSVCATPSATADLRMLIPVQVAGSNTPAYRVVRYYRSNNGTGSELLRDGPQVNANGTLLSTTTNTASRVLTNVSSFVPTVSADCTWVTLQVGLTVPGSATVVNRTLTLYSGAGGSIN